MNPTDGWTKSSYSSFEGNCVEVRPGFLTVAIRDSKDPEGPTLSVGVPEWRAFVEAVKAGDMGGS